MFLFDFFVFCVWVLKRFATFKKNSQWREEKTAPGLFQARWFVVLAFTQRDHFKHISQNDCLLVSFGEKRTADLVQTCITLLNDAHIFSHVTSAVRQNVSLNKFEVRGKKQLSNLNILLFHTFQVWFKKNCFDFCDSLRDGFLVATKHLKFTSPFWQKLCLSCRL